MVYSFYRNLFLFTLRYFKVYNESVVGHFLRYNNNRALKWADRGKVSKVFLLLPHCIQNSHCKIRITTDIDNCISCGRCKIGYLETLKRRYPSLLVKVATGGTLARNYIKEFKPDLIIAVACKRDLILGITDAQPFHVYGILNKILAKDCIDTDFSVDEIENILEKLLI